MNIIKFRNFFYAVSLIVIIPGIIALFIWGLKFGIDFRGGTLWEINFEEQSQVEVEQIKGILNSNDTQFSQIAKTSDNSALIRLQSSDEGKINDLKGKLSESLGKTNDLRLETVGPTISRELAQKALTAVGVAIIAILLYITWAFRKVPRPTSSLAFGIATIVAVLHDVIVVVGTFAILGHYLGFEIDSLFITALLTVIGFSVHDTIVVFDRIRENLKKHDEMSFEQVVNHSLVQTMARSLNTSLTAVFVLFALLIFGGETIRVFVLALLIGVISGTYSSLFNAAPLLVSWNNLRKKISKS